MRRVLLAVVIVSVWIALSCAALENELQCGSASVLGRRCAAALATDEEEKKKIAEARKLTGQARSQVGKLTAPSFEFAEYCEKTEEYHGKSEDAQKFFAEYVEATKNFLQEFTALDVQENLQKLEGFAENGKNAHETTLKSKSEVCTFSQQFVSKVSKVQEILAKTEAALAELEKTFSEQAVEEIKRLSAQAVQEVEDLLKEAQEAKITINKTFSAADAAGNAADELRGEALDVFNEVKKAYKKCDAEFRSKLKNGDARGPEDKNHEEEMRLQTCQKKKEEKSSSSANADSGKSNEKDATTTAPKPTPKPDTDTESNNSEEEENNSGSNEATTAKPTQAPDNSKREEQKDTATHQALLKNACFLCVLVIVFFVLTGV